MGGDASRRTARLTWVGGVGQESGAADADGQVVGGGVLRLVALLRRALPPGHRARPVLLVGEPPDRQDPVVVQADLV